MRTLSNIHNFGILMLIIGLVCMIGAEAAKHPALTSVVGSLLAVSGFLLSRVGRKE